MYEISLKPASRTLLEEQNALKLAITNIYDPTENDLVWLKFGGQTNNGGQ